MDKLRTIILPPERWGEIEPIEREEFSDVMPSSSRQTSFLTAVDGDGDIAGYLRVEHLYHLIHVYAKPDRRNHASLARQLMTEAAECVPKGFSGIWLTRKPYPGLATILGARELPGGPFRIYRRDS